MRGVLFFTGWAAFSLPAPSEPAQESGCSRTRPRPPWQGDAQLQLRPRCRRPGSRAEETASKGSQKDAFPWRPEGEGGPRSAARRGKPRGKATGAVPRIREPRPGAVDSGTGRFAHPRLFRRSRAVFSCARPDREPAGAQRLTRARFRRRRQMCPGRFLWRGERLSLSASCIPPRSSLFASFPVKPSSDYFMPSFALMASI